MPTVTANKKKAKPEKAEPKTSAAHKRAAVKPKKLASTSTKLVTAPLLVANTPAILTLEDISNIFDSLPSMHVCSRLVGCLHLSCPFLKGWIVLGPS
jgi:hypothetical protein